MKLGRTIFYNILAMCCFLFIEQQAFATKVLKYGKGFGDSTKLITYYRASAEGMVKVYFYKSGIFSYMEVSMQSNSSVYSCGNWYIHNDTLYAISSKKPYFNLIHNMEQSSDTSVFWYKFQYIAEKYLLKKDSLYYLAPLENFNSEKDCEDSVIQSRLKISSDFKNPLNSGKVLSVWEGKVLSVEKGKRNKFIVAIKHINYISIYEDIDSVYIKDGDWIESFQVIGSCHSQKLSSSKYLANLAALPPWYKFKLIKL